ncbi:DUF421 domain-containing protein [Acidipila rosea]|uniref:Uncharacterized protein DUF421 n=1 Tax=Acidipila rosea TaxID=768535 RepID=A0A4R1L7K9_9BACT|nr:YetF domain-containing protein [Acidipila rosea]MBW4043894.1 DUF421 domain-containing protein [Acidobacteriota bacterium]TCK74198.1 uncharacterized protein DUF421 [Acidipila rosea]
MATVLHAVFGYFFLLLTVRILTRRPGGQLTLFEFVIVFLIGGVIILSTVGKDRSLTNCVCAIITVGLLHQSVSWLRARYPRFGVIVDGTPLLVLDRGKWDTDLMKKMRLDENDVMAAARSKGLTSLTQIKYAVLERNGSISIIQAEASKSEA